MTESLRTGHIIAYAATAIPLAFAGIPLYIHAPDFYVTHYGASLTAVGILLLVLRFADAILDPLIGFFSDQFSRHRFAIMAAAAILLIPAFAALFSPDKTILLPWFIITMLLATAAYSVLSINLNSLGGLWSRDAHQKTRITSWREAFGLIGLLCAVILPSVLMQHMPATEAFQWVAAVLALLMLASILLLGRWYRTHARTKPPASSAAPLKIFATFKQLPLLTRRFFAIYAAGMLASSIPAVLILFFVRDRLGAEAFTGMFLAIYFISAACAMPLWLWVSRRFGKIRAWLYAMLLAIVSFVWAYFLGAGDITAFAIICALSGTAFAADLALPPSILADMIQQHEQEDSATLQFSLMAFLLKTAAALASAFSFLLMDATGLQPGKENTAHALAWLSIAYAIIPCAIKLAACALLYVSMPSFSKGDDDEKTTSVNGSTAYANRM